MIYWPAKAPIEDYDWTFDFREPLDTGETIASKTVTVTGATKHNEAIVAVGGEAASGVQVWLSGGTLGATATVKCTVVTSASRTFSEVASLKIGSEPLSLSDVKSSLRVVSSDEDARIAAMIPRARLWVEDHTGLALVQRQFEERRRTEHASIRLFKGPLVSVDSVTYGDAQTFMPLWKAPDTRIVAALDEAWPVLEDGDAFEITYTAGYAEGEVDDRLIGAMLALIEGEFSDGFAYPQRATDAAERCCGYLRMVAV